MDDVKSTIHAAGKTLKASADRPSPPDGAALGTLTSRIGKLALQERDAVRRRDWSVASSVAEERTALQKARQVAAARRLA
jgi:hypothetical protein